MEIKHGDIVTFYGISWNDGWDFGNPNIIISPILRFTEDAGSIESAVDELCIDMCTDEIYSDSINTEDWRDWNIKEFTDFVINYFNGNSYKIPKDFIEYYNSYLKDKEDLGIESDKECWDIIDLHVSKFVVKFTKNEDADEDEYYFDYEEISNEIKWIDYNEN
jgi:hypothetical protein